MLGGRDRRGGDVVLVEGVEGRGEGVEEGEVKMEEKGIEGREV